MLFHVGFGVTGGVCGPLKFDPGLQRDDPGLQRETKRHGTRAALAGAEAALIVKSSTTFATAEATAAAAAATAAHACNCVCVCVCVRPTVQNLPQPEHSVKVCKELSRSETVRQFQNVLQGNLAHTDCVVSGA